MLEVGGAPQALTDARPAGPSVSGEALVPRLDVVHGGREQPRQRRPEDEVVVVADDLLAEPREVLLGEHGARAAVQHAAAPGVDDEHAGAARRRAGTTSGTPWSPRSRGPPAGRGRAGSARRPRRAPTRAGPGTRGRRPARPGTGSRDADTPSTTEPADDALLPPRQPVHVLAPRPRGVPVVVHVMVVEDHGGRHGGQQPAHLGVLPRLVVEPGVLLEVRDLRARARPDVAPGGDCTPRLLGELVGVDLVAEQQQQVRQLVVDCLVAASRRASASSASGPIASSAPTARGLA